MCTDGSIAYSCAAKRLLSVIIHLMSKTTEYSATHYPEVYSNISVAVSICCGARLACLLHRLLSVGTPSLEFINIFLLKEVSLPRHAVILNSMSSIRRTV